MECINCIGRKERQERERKQREDVKGSATVEMSYIMPLLLLLFLFITYTVFYYHDKLILNGAAAETAVLGAQLERKKEAADYDLEEIFEERIKGKLIYMTDVDVSVQRDEDEITVSGCCAEVCYEAEYLPESRYCKTGGKNQMADLKISYEKDWDSACIHADLPCPYAEDYQLRMLKNNFIPHLAHVDGTGRDGTEQVYVPVGPEEY